VCVPARVCACVGACVLVCVCTRVCVIDLSWWLLRKAPTVEVTVERMMASSSVSTHSEHTASGIHSGTSVGVLSTAAETASACVPLVASAHKIVYAHS